METGIGIFAAWLWLCVGVAIGVLITAVLSMSRDR